MDTWIRAFTPIPFQNTYAALKPHLVRPSPIHCHITDSGVQVVPFNILQAIERQLHDQIDYERHIPTDRLIVEGALEVFYMWNTFEIPCQWIPCLLEFQLGVLVEGVAFDPKCSLKHLRLVIKQTTAAELNRLAPHLALLLDCKYLETVWIEFEGQMCHKFLEDSGAFVEVCEKLEGRLPEGLQMNFPKWHEEGVTGVMKLYKHRRARILSR